MKIEITGAGEAGAAIARSLVQRQAGNNLLERGTVLFPSGITSGTSEFQVA
ncbi:hypothetical protein [Pannonibacter phragmitetus]|uniref:hypothetical protein n=1 Tax=Pannonibacter phragmitetus TaxID=121719 RepID=UPI003D2F48AE